MCLDIQRPFEPYLGIIQVTMSLIANINKNLMQQILAFIQSDDTVYNCVTFVTLHARNIMKDSNTTR